MTITNNNNNNRARNNPYINDDDDSSTNTTVTELTDMQSVVNHKDRTQHDLRHYVNGVLPPPPPLATYPASIYETPASATERDPDAQPTDADRAAAARRPQIQRQEAINTCKECFVVFVCCMIPIFLLGLMILLPVFVGGSGSGSGGGSSSSYYASSGGGGGYCFSPNSLIRMEDGSVKAIADIQLGDVVARGGRVVATMHFASSSSSPHNMGLCRLTTSNDDDKDEQLSDEVNAVVAMPDHLFYSSEHSYNDISDDVSGGEDKTGSFVPSRSLTTHDNCIEEVDIVYDIDTEYHLIEFANGLIATDFNEHDVHGPIQEIEFELALNIAVREIYNNDNNDNSMTVEDETVKTNTTTTNPNNTNTKPSFLYFVDFGGSSLVKMLDGTYRPISSIEVGDVVARGGQVTGKYEIDGYYVDGDDNDNASANDSNTDGRCTSSASPSLVISDDFLVYDDTTRQFVPGRPTLLNNGGNNSSDNDDVDEQQHEWTCTVQQQPQPQQQQESNDVWYHLDTEFHVFELEGGYVTIDYSEHDVIHEISQMELELTKDLAASVVSSMRRTE